VREGGMTAGVQSAAAGDRWRFAVLVACLLISLGVYAAFAVILGSVPPGWDSPIQFSMESGPLFRSFTRLPFVVLSPPAFTRAMVAVFLLLWALWGVAVLALRGLSNAELRRRAVVVAIAGAAAMLLLVVVFVPTVLSSDLYRQAVYGRMVAYHGLNPYEMPVNAVPGDPLFAFANHRHLTTHYGPAYTLLSALCAAIAPSTVLGGALAWKAMSACAALGCAVLSGPVVRAIGGTDADGQNAQLWLAWNPLLIVESASAGHVEPIMMLPALAGILFCQRGRPVRGVVALVVSTLTKWFSGLLVPFVIVREVWQAEPRRRLRLSFQLAGASGLTAALLYAPFIRGLAKRAGGLSDIALRGGATVGNAPTIPLPQWALLAGFAVLVLGALAFVARGDWQRLVAVTSALALVFVLFVNPWPFPWYFLAPMMFAALLAPGRPGFVLRGLTVGLGVMSTLHLYAPLAPLAH
jgi:hypothetical protein